MPGPASTLSHAIRAAILRALGATDGRFASVGTTGWGEAWSVTLGDERYFVKLVARGRASMLECEAEGLRAIAETGALRVPEVHATGLADTGAYLVLEWLDLRRLGDGRALGGALARMHAAAPPRGAKGERFGWARDNWIGGTPQRNGWAGDWTAFFRDARLAPQFDLARANGFAAIASSATRVLALVPRLLEGHAPEPSLVHGDLWSGNVASLSGGEPVVFDPAVYAGDAEVDVAMTELFGGFGPDFMAAYGRLRPLRTGYPQRRELYNLYHLLNHLNLFGEAYLDRVRRSVHALIALASP
jgi:protein-ribulosamine 3-kinase